MGIVNRETFESPVGLHKKIDYKAFDKKVRLSLPKVFPNIADIISVSQRNAVIFISYKLYD